MKPEEIQVTAERYRQAYIFHQDLDRARTERYQAHANVEGFTTEKDGLYFEAWVSDTWMRRENNLPYFSHQEVPGSRVCHKNRIAALEGTLNKMREQFQILRLFDAIR